MRRIKGELNVDTLLDIARTNPEAINQMAGTFREISEKSIEDEAVLVHHSSMHQLREMKRNFLKNIETDPDLWVKTIRSAARTENEQLQSNLVEELMGLVFLPKLDEFVLNRLGWEVDDQYLSDLVTARCFGFKEIMAELLIDRYRGDIEKLTSFIREPIMSKDIAKQMMKDVDIVIRENPELLIFVEKIQQTGTLLEEKEENSISSVLNEGSDSEEENNIPKP